jgi:hypothetical protein
MPAICCSATKRGAGDALGLNAILDRDTVRSLGVKRLPETLHKS